MAAVDQGPSPAGLLARHSDHGRGKTATTPARLDGFVEVARMLGGDLAGLRARLVGSRDRIAAAADIATYGAWTPPVR